MVTGVPRPVHDPSDRPGNACVQSEAAGPQIQSQKLRGSWE